MSRTQRGFTLMEVLVALAVLAIALGAIIKAAGEGATHIGRLRDQTLASWVALNRLNETLLSEDWPAEGSDNGVAEMANREWPWELTVSATADEDLRRLDISVRDQDDQPPLAVLSAFMGRPP